MHPLAYRVPFAVDRSLAPDRYYLVNHGNETLERIRLSLLGSGLMLPLSRRRLAPGTALAFAPRGENLGRDSVVIVRWFRPNGDEYLWRVSF